MRKILPALVGVFTFLVCMLVATTVWAQGETAAPAVTRVTELVFQILTPIVTIFVTWLAHRLIKVFESRTNIDIPDKQEAKIDGWIEQGIHLAAEKSYQKVKAKTDKLKGPEKLEEAAEFVFALANSRGWIDWTKAKIKAKVEAAIGFHRANGGVPNLEDDAN